MQKKVMLLQYIHWSYLVVFTPTFKQNSHATHVASWGDIPSLVSPLDSAPHCPAVAGTQD